MPITLIIPDNTRFFDDGHSIVAVNDARVKSYLQSKAYTNKPVASSSLAEALVSGKSLWFWSETVKVLVGGSKTEAEVAA
jgi:hypothetical protein